MEANSQGHKAPHPPQIPGGLAAGGREVLIGLSIDRDSSAPFEAVSPQREPCRVLPELPVKMRLGGGRGKNERRGREQSKARRKIDGSLQAGGSCGCDEYLPCSGLMILEMFFSDCTERLWDCFSRNKIH